MFRQAIARALEWQPLTVEDINRSCGLLHLMLPMLDTSFQLKMASALWAQRGISLEPNFLQRTHQFHAAEIR